LLLICASLGGRVAFAFHPRFLPGPVIPHGHPDPTRRQLRESGTFPRFAKPSAGGGRKIVHLAPRPKVHDSVVVESTIPFPTGGSLFEWGYHGGSVIAQGPPLCARVNPVKKSDLISGIVLRKIRPLGAEQPGDLGRRSLNQVHDLGAAFV
jgi:hypothetical protein